MKTEQKVNLFGSFTQLLCINVSRNLLIYWIYFIEVAEEKWRTEFKLHLFNIEMNCGQIDSTQRKIDRFIRLICIIIERWSRRFE